MTQQESNPALLPCPFCQGAATAKLIPETNGDWHHVDVTHIEGCFYKPKAERLLLNTKSLSAWNTRTAPAQAEPAASATQAGVANQPAPAAVAVPDEVPESVIDAVAEALGDAYDCGRVWSAWGVGTMSQDDFYPVAEDGDRVAEIANAAISAYLAATPAAKAAKAEVQAEPVTDDYPHEQMDALALSRYKVVPSDQSMYWRHAVVAGDGQQHLYNGSEVDCQNLARKFAGAFLDGAFAFHSLYTAPQAQPADALDASPVAKRLLHGHEPWEIPAQTIQRDAVRYRWIRTQFWDEGSMCVVMNPKSHVVLGAICPSHKQLDSAIDAAMAAAQEGGKV